MQPKFNPTIDFYTEELDESIIDYLSQIRSIARETAMDIYYRSRLSSQIAERKYGIENLDYKNLAEDLVENEPELVR